MGDVEVEVVGPEAGGEEETEDADGVILAKDEVEQIHEASHHAQDPEQPGDNRFARLAGGQQLHELARAEHENAQVADEFPGGNGNAEEREQGFVHESCLLMTAKTTSHTVRNPFAVNAPRISGTSIPRSAATVKNPSRNFGQRKRRDSVILSEGAESGCEWET